MKIVQKMPPRHLLKFQDFGKGVAGTRWNSTASVCPVFGEIHKNENQVQAFEDIPGPKAMPLVGNLLRFLPYIGRYGSEHMQKQMHLLRNDFGDIVRLEGIWGRRSTVFLFDAENCEKMYRSEGIWPARIAIETMKRYREKNPDIFKGQLGLVSSQGKMWHDFRSNVNQHMMQPRAIKPHVAQVDQVTAEFIEKMRKLRDAETSILPTNFNNELNKWALESICSIALDHRMGCLNGDLAADSDPQRMINAVHEMFELFFLLETRPSLWKIYETRTLKKLFAALDMITGNAIKHIDAAKKRFATQSEEIKNDKNRDRSILESLLSIDEQTAYIMALDMLTAGIDTTSNAGGTLLYYVSTDQRVQEKLREEVLRVLPEKDSPVTYSALMNGIPYLKACIKETLRLSPIAIGNLRTMEKEVVLCGYRVPAGTDVVACHALLARDSKHFPNPEVFIPERWLRNNTEVASAKDAHPFAYMPFGFGPRTCIGRRFAELEIETLALKVLRNFRLEWTGPPLVIKTRFINTIGSPLKFKLTDL